MERYVSQNILERERLVRLSSTLSHAELNSSVSNNWTVATKLIHLAFWDRYYLALLDDWEQHGFKDTRAQVNAINQAVLDLSQHIPMTEVSHLVNNAAFAIDQKLERLDSDLATIIQEHGHDRILKRYLHRKEHLEQIEQSLGYL
jgi:hypothetical protein